MLHKLLFGGVHQTRFIRSLLGLFLVVCGALTAKGQTYSVLHSFTDGTDGAVPSPIIRDAQGNLYGTTRFGGNPSCGEDTCGTVFKIDNAGNESVLYRFEGGTSGSNPVAALVEDAAGNLYGTTQGNGFIGGDSVIFKVDPSGQQSVLYVADTPQASALDSPLALDAEGNLYGMSPYAGNSDCRPDQLGCGNLFRLSPSGELTVLHTFTPNEGMQPEGGVVLDSKGNIYGTANFGGDLACKSLGYGYFIPGCGTIYKLDSSGNFSILHTFTGRVDGSFPLGLITDLKETSTELRKMAATKSMATTPSMAMEQSSKLMLRATLACSTLSFSVPSLRVRKAKCATRFMPVI